MSVAYIKADLFGPFPFLSPQKRNRYRLSDEDIEREGGEDVRFSQHRDLRKAVCFLGGSKPKRQTGTPLRGLPRPILKGAGTGNPLHKTIKSEGWVFEREVSCGGPERHYDKIMRLIKTENRKEKAGQHGNCQAVLQDVVTSEREDHCSSSYKKARPSGEQMQPLCQANHPPAKGKVV